MATTPPETTTTEPRDVLAFPILHPSYIIRGQWAQLPFQVLFLKRVKYLADHGRYPVHDPMRRYEPGFYDPTLEQCHEWQEGIDRNWGITCDVEDAGNVLTRIGFARVHDEVPLVLRFRLRGGDLPVSPDELQGRAVFAANLLADPSVPKVFHNGQTHDVPILESIGFEVNNYAADTILMQNLAYPEAPKGLEFCSVAYGGMNRWKYLATTEDEGEGK